MHMCPERVLPSTSRMGSVCDADGRAVGVESEVRRIKGIIITEYHTFIHYYCGHSLLLALQYIQDGASNMKYKCIYSICIHI